VHLSVTGEAGEALSHGCVDPELAKPGTELVVEWGDHGRRIKKARVTVERFPYLTEKRNSD
jgi:glycine cleavage system aminomethyltransferase T